MSPRIQVTSFAALEELEVAIGRFSSRTIEALEDAERQISRKRQTLDEIVTERKRAVSYWRREYDRADPEEDDVSSISYKLERAEDDLRDAKRWQGRVEDSYQMYSRRARDCAYVCTEHTGKARAILKRKIRDLYDYAALHPGSAGEQAAPPTLLTDSAATLAAPGIGGTTGSSPPSPQHHDENYQKYMERILAKNIEFRELGQKYVDVANIRSLENGNHDWGQNNEHFWRHHGNSPELYDSMATKYRALRERLAGGETLEDLRLDDQWRPAIDFWWSNSDPVRLVQFQDSYFVEQGFHRVTLAKREGLGEIPCSVQEARLKK